MSGWNQEQEFQAGVRAERERIIKLLKANFIDNELLDLAIALIKDKTRNITSEILPDGTIYIEEVEMGN